MLKREQNQAVLRISNQVIASEQIDIEHVFDRFYKADAARSKTSTGLGLSIARNLAKLMDGTLEITVDGDLFKVQVAFPEVVKQETRQEADPEGTQPHQAV